MAHYRLGMGSVDELRARVEQGPLQAMPEVPGFVAYHAFDAGAGVVASVTLFDDRSGLAEAEFRLSRWIEQTISRFEILPGDVSEGDVFASTRGEPPI